VFQWTAEADTTFDTLKTAMCSIPVLALSDFEQPFEIETDAYDKGVRAILSQQGHPIAFFQQGTEYIK
jgi:hypothetical protein